MRFFRTLALAAVALLALAAGRGAEAAERRLALVIGEAAYPEKPLATAANDAGLVAQTLQAAGFDVTGARDLEEAALKQAFRDFLDKVTEAGKDAVAFVYVSGYGVQLEGENYIVPVDAKITRDSDIPMRALRVSDYLKPLTASGAKLNVVVLDAARANPFKLAGQPIAGGLALYEPGGPTLLAFNAAPGTIAPAADKDYGPYAHALAEMMRDGGRPLMEVFENTRLRVSEMTKGAQIPWNSQKIETSFVFFEREAGAPPRREDAARLSQPISALGPDDGFSAALRRDTLQGYQDYVATYPASPYARRARAMAAARREAMTWRRSRLMDTPDAYWSYLRRYPKGPHAWDARRRLAELRYELEPPAEFAAVDYGYPPPPPDELVFVEQPAVYFDDPVWAFPPPPPPPIYFLPPPPPDFIVLPPPVVIAVPYMLPAPPYVPVPVWQRPPAYIAPPQNNFIFTNMHNAVMVNPAENRVIVRSPAGGVIATEALTGAAVGAGAAAVGVGATLPQVISKRNPPVAPVGVTPPGGQAPGLAPGLAPGAERPATLPAGAMGKDQPPPSGAGALPPGAGALPAGGASGGLPKDHALPKPPAGGESLPGGQRPRPQDATITGPESAPHGRDKRGPGAPTGVSGDHALPTPANADAASGGAGRRGRRDQPVGDRLPTGDRLPPIGGHDRLAPPAGGAASSAGERPGGRPPPRGDVARPDRLQPTSPMGGERLGRQPPAGLESGGQMTPFPGESRPHRNARPERPPPQDDMGGFGGPPSGRMRGDPMGGEMRAPARMRPPPVDAPEMRGFPGGNPMRGMPRDAMPRDVMPRDAMPREMAPPRSEPPRYQGGGFPGGAPPQMREMGRPSMPMPAPQPARSRDDGPRRHGEDGGGPPGFGGMMR
jgi:uncharacterized caspase-like protein